jgi:pilus assembly protein CpaB
MRRNKVVLLAVAVVIAAGGTGLVAVYVNGASSPATAQEDLVKVLTASSVIPVGETAKQAQSEGKLALTAVPRSSVVTGAVTSVDTMGDQVALAPIYPGEQILALNFGTTVASQQVLPVPKGLLAISLELSDPGRVAGFVTPGSHVAIFVSFKGTGDAAGPASFTRILVSNVEVIGVGPSTILSPADAVSDASGTGVVPQTVLTVALNQHDADRVVFAANNDVLTFGLLGTATKIIPDLGVTQPDLLK